MKTRMLFVLMSIAAVALFWHGTGCKKNPVAPEPRNLSWSVDTLAHPINSQHAMWDIWGSSANDVYVCGNASTAAGILWHFNGKDWQDVKLTVAEGGTVLGSLDIHAVWGFGPNDVWCVGDRAHDSPDPRFGSERRSLILHFNGRQWQEISHPGGSSLFSIWGRSPDDVWFGGNVSTLFHYNGTTVEKIPNPEVMIAAGDSTWVYAQITGDTHKAYMLVANSNWYPNLLMELIDDTWQIIDNEYIAILNDLWLSPSGTLYRVGGVVERWRQGAWEILFNDIDQRANGNQLSGTSDNNLFLTTIARGRPSYGKLYHYNGADWQEILKADFPNSSFQRSWTDGREVFVIGRVNGDESLVWHGK